MSLLSQAQEYRATIALLVVGTIAGFVAGRLTPANSPESNSPPASIPAPESKDAASTPAVLKRVEGKEKAPVTNTTDSDWEDEGQGELSDFSGMNEECKLVLVVRTDLGMTKGTRGPSFWVH